MSLAERAFSVMLPITEPERAREFYGERLQLPYEGTDGDGSLLFGLGGGARLVLRRLPAGEQSGHTTLSFSVDDLPAEISRLEGRGVRFEDYDEPDFRTVNHILARDGEQAAWFLDPDGNVLCLHHEGGA